MTHWGIERVTEMIEGVTEVIEEVKSELHIRVSASYLTKSQLRF